MYRVVLKGITGEVIREKEFSNRLHAYAYANALARDVLRESLYVSVVTDETEEEL